MKLLKIIWFAAAAYFALYATIWFHELGHALVYWLSGCKSNLFDLHVPFHFGGSNPYPLVENCADQMTSAAILWASLNGMFFNVILIILGTQMVQRVRHSFLHWFLLVLVCSSYIEIISYLTVCNIIPMGDMEYIHTLIPSLQIVLFLTGIYTAISLVKFIKSSPENFRRPTSIFSISTFSSMVIMRIIFLFF